MNLIDYNIEYAHIYSDEFFGEEQKKGIQKLHTTIDRLEKEQKSFCTAVLIDEYNPVRDELIIKQFLNSLGKYNAQPDFICFESRLIFAKNWLLEQISPELREKYTKYIETHQKIPCSFLITIWYLKRLGILNHSQITIEKLKKTSKTFEAKKIINILPKRFEQVEKKAIEIIESTKFAKYAKNIEYIFF